MEAPIKDAEEDHLEVTVHQHDDDLDASAEESEFSGCVRTLGVTNLTPNVDRVQLRVIRCILAQPEQEYDWRRIAIFQTCI